VTAPGRRKPGLARAARTVHQSPGPIRPEENHRMLFFVVENFRNGDAVPVYRRFRDQGRLAPSGVSYVSSWVTPDLHRCFQVMECDSRASLDAWIARWADLVDFEVTPVITSQEALTAVTPLL
jgi:uncharacterized protein DUF3303